MSEFLAVQAAWPPNNHYFDDAIVSWNIRAEGMRGTAGIIQPGFSGEFDIPAGGERVRLLKPTADELIEFDILAPDGSVTNSLVLAKHGEVFIPEGPDRLTTPIGQRAVHYLCLYPGRPL